MNAHLSLRKSGVPRQPRRLTLVDSQTSSQVKVAVFTRLLLALCTVLAIPAVAVAQPARGDMALLAPASKVFIEPDRDNAHVIMGEKIAKWGRWTVVDVPADADLTIKLLLSGSAGWGRGSITAMIYDTKADALLWTSKQQTGNRTVFHGYASPYKRAGRRHHRPDDQSQPDMGHDSTSVAPAHHCALSHHPPGPHHGISPPLRQAHPSRVSLFALGM